MTAHYGILKSTATDDISSHRQRLPIKSGTPQPFLVRIVEDSVNSESQSAQIVSGLIAPEQASSPLKTSNKMGDRLDELSLSKEENPKRLGENLDGFYTFEEVDEPAVPQEDWEIPLKAIGAMGIKFLIIRAWIDDNGNMFDIEVLSSTPQTLMIQDREKIISALLRTKMTPAIKSGRNVPSQRTIEMALEL